MQKAKKKPCVHDNVKFGSDEQALSSYHHFFDPHCFPLIDPFNCTNDCREKMIRFFQFKTEQLSKWITLYYEDATTVEDHPNEKDDHSYKPTLSDYWCFFKAQPIGELERPVLQHMKVGLLGGKPVRLCDLPEGTKCDFDASNLEEFDKANE